ncbi:MAG: fibronectin type III domain-containing protein [bacterium]|nr:fibronectin type III domain-containing protein [bacterium]
MPGDFIDGRMLDGELSTRFTGLSKDTSYVLRLWWWGSSRWNEVTPSPVCKTTPVAAPVLTAHTTGGNTLTIEWNPVDGAEVYQVRYRPSQSAGASGASGTNDWRTVVSTGEFHTVTGLSPGTEYTVEIRAGIGSPRRWSAVPSHSYTLSPTTCVASTTTSITISWDDTADRYHWQTRRITGINQYTDTKTFAKGGATETTYTGLQPDTEYWFGVWHRAETTDQWQPYTPFPHCHTSPSNPAIYQCPHTADSSGTIRWTPNGASYYRITSQGTAANPNWIITNANSHTFANLAEGTTYTVKLQAWNPSGWSTGRTCQMTTLPAIPTGTLTATSGTKYYFTKGAVKGVLYAAGKAINDRSTSTSTVTQITCGNGGSMAINQLAAIMLSIPVHEVPSGTSASRAPSPMVLSRWDNLGQQRQTHAGVTASLNVRLYSHMDTAGYLRAHWNPGVGLWQLDKLNDATINMNHAARADTIIGGVEVAQFLLGSYCRNTVGDQGLKDALNNRWFGCMPYKRDVNGQIVVDELGNRVRIPDVCYKTYTVNAHKVYMNGKLNIGIVDALDEVDGGVQERLCRWNSSGRAMPCYLYDINAVQGVIDGDDKTGQNSGRTPLSEAFISLSDTETNTKYAVWPKQWPRSSAHMDWPTDVVISDKAIYRAAKGGEEIRCSPGRDSTSEATNDCAEGTYEPFGDEIADEDFSGGNRIVEGWYDDSVPYRNGDTTADRHSLQVQTCDREDVLGHPVVNCWWVDI